ncbi:MAG: hypothetical protein ABEJ43_11465 [Haloferacaceae archaeon]
MRLVDRVLAYLPALLVPLAWTFTTLVGFTALVSATALRVGLSVMCVLFAVFAAHPEMRGPALGAWRAVIVAGLVATLAALATLVFGGEPGLLAGRFAVVVWLGAPAYGLVRTGRALANRRYDGFAAASLVGAALVASAALPQVPPAAALAGLLVGGLGQTASVADAVVRQARSQSRSA